MKEFDDSAKKRGERLKLLRAIANLKRDELALLADVSKATLSYWENASLSELTEKGAKKIIDALRKKNIDCSIEWLLFGTGSSPLSSTIIQNQLLENTDSNKKIQTLEDEIKLFLRNIGTQIIRISTTTMSPILEPDMIIGIVWLKPYEFFTGKQKICVINYNGELDVRKIDAISPNNEFDLSYLNYSPNLKKPFHLKGLKLNQIAPVIRAWETISTTPPSFAENLQEIH